MNCVVCLGEKFGLFKSPLTTPTWRGKDKGYVLRPRGYVMRLSISYRGRNLGG